MSAHRTRSGGLSAWPFAVFAVVLLTGRLLDGLLSVLLPVTLAVLAPLMVVTVRTVRADARMNARLGRQWRRHCAVQNARAAARERGAA